MVTILALLGVLGVLFAAAVLSTRDTKVLADAPRDAADVPLPEEPLRPEDVGGLRFSLAARGYRMSEVDLALERLALELADRDRRIGLLEAAAEGHEKPSAVREATVEDLPAPPPPVAAAPTASVPVEPVAPPPALVPAPPPPAAPQPAAAAPVAPDVIAPASTTVPSTPVTAVPPAPPAADPPATSAPGTAAPSTVVPPAPAAPVAPAPAALSLDKPDAPSEAPDVDPVEVSLAEASLDGPAGPAAPLPPADLASELVADDPQPGDHPHRH